MCILQSRTTQFLWDKRGKNVSNFHTEDIDRTSLKLIIYRPRYNKSSKNKLHQCSVSTINQRQNNRGIRRQTSQICSVGFSRKSNWFPREFTSTGKRRAHEQIENRRTELRITRLWQQWELTYYDWVKWRSFCWDYT